MVKPRVCVAGPLLGSNEGWVVSQGEVLGERLMDEGYEVLMTSSKLGRWRRMIDIFVSLIKWRRRYDVVVVMVYSGPAFWVARMAAGLANRLRKKLVLWLHGGALPSYLGEHPAARRWLETAADRIIAPSHYLLANLSGATPKLIIRNTLPVEQVPFMPRRDLLPSMLWMRTFHSIYQPLLALDVVELLVTKGVAATLTFAGQDKGMRDVVASAVEERGLADHVSILGFLDEDAKLAAFARHDIYLNTTAVDNFPVSLVEAAAAGLIVVSTAVGGIPSLFTDGINALLADTSDPVDLADAVVRVVDEPLLAERLSREGRNLAELCTWREIGGQWTGLLDDLQDGKDGRGPAAVR